MAEVVPVGESEGRLITRPLESCSWSLPILARFAWSDPSELRVSMFWVTRVYDISDPPRSG